jgi:tRNA-dihydrouridine synthase B
MTRAVKIPVTVKMRAGWSDRERNAPTLARMVEDAGAAAVTIHGRTAEQSYSGFADWELVSRIAETLQIPVFGSGDCVEPEQIVARMQSGVSGVLVGRGVLRNPWILAQAADLAAGRQPRTVTLEERGRFLHAYIDLLLGAAVNEVKGFRHSAPGADRANAAGVAAGATARGHQRWVINKIRALCSWYSKGLDCGSQMRVRVNRTESIAELRAVVDEYFLASPVTDVLPV